MTVNRQLMYSTLAAAAAGLDTGDSSADKMAK